MVEAKPSGSGQKLLERNSKTGNPLGSRRLTPRRAAVQLVNPLGQSEHLDGFAVRINDPVFRESGLFVEGFELAFIPAENQVNFPVWRSRFAEDAPPPAPGLLKYPG